MTIKSRLLSDLGRIQCKTFILLQSSNLKGESKGSRHYLSQYINEKETVVLVSQVYLYLSGFAKRYLQDILATVSFEACSVLDHFFFLRCFQYKKPLTSSSTHTHTHTHKKTHTHIQKRRVYNAVCIFLDPIPPPPPLPYLSFTITLSVS